MPVYRYRTRTAGSEGYRYAPGLAAVPKASTGFASIGIAFHAYATARSGTVPVYQWRRADAAGQPLLRYGTGSAVPAGWVSDGVVFHVPA